MKKKNFEAYFEYFKVNCEILTEASFYLQPYVENILSTVLMKTLTISLFNNSEKLVQILLEFSQQIVEGYEFVLAKFTKKTLSVNPNLRFKGPMKCKCMLICADL